eukprot:jgi/Ulvmu1/8333/UM042_0039.1
MEKLSVGIASRGGLVTSGDGALSGSALSSGPRRRTFVGGNPTAPIKAVCPSQPPPVGALISASQPANPNVDTKPQEYHRLANSPHTPYGLSSPEIRAKSAPGNLPSAASTTADATLERDPFGFTSADDDADTVADVDHQKSEGEDNDASPTETAYACVEGPHDVSRLAPAPAKATGPNACTILALWRPALAPHAAFPHTPPIARKTYTILRMLLALPATLHRPPRQPALTAAALPTPFTLQAQPRTVQAFTKGAARPLSVTAQSCTTVIRWILPLSPILLALRNREPVFEPSEHTAVDSLQALLQHQPQQNSGPPLAPSSDGTTESTAIIPWQSPAEVLLRWRLPHAQAQAPPPAHRTVRPTAVLRTLRPSARVLRAIVACRWHACSSLALRKPPHTHICAPTQPRRSTRCARAALQQLTIVFGPLRDMISRSARGFLPADGNTAPPLLRHNLCCHHAAPQQLTIVWAPLCEMINRSIRMSRSAPGQRPLFRIKCTAIIPWAAPESVVLAPLRRLLQASPATTTATPPPHTRLISMLCPPQGLLRTLLPSVVSARTTLVPRRAQAEVITPRISRGTRHVLRMLHEISSARIAASRSRANACTDLVVCCPALPGAKEWEDLADEVAEEVQDEAVCLLPCWKAVMRRAMSVLRTVALLTLMVVWLSATP